MLTYFLEKPESDIELSGQNFSMFSSFVSKNSAAISGSHSFSETVFHFSLSFFRLICSFHDNSPFKILWLFSFNFGIAYDDTAALG